MTALINVSGTTNFASLSLSPLYSSPSVLSKNSNSYCVSISSTFPLQYASLRCSSKTAARVSPTSVRSLISVSVPSSGFILTMYRDHESALTCFFPGLCSISNSYSANFRTHLVNRAHWWFFTVISHLSAAWCHDFEFAPIEETSTRGIKKFPDWTCRVECMYLI